DLLREEGVEGRVGRSARDEALDALDGRVAEAGLDRARLDHDHVDTEGPHLEAERVAERLHGVLGGVVEGAAREREPPAHRGEVHDPAPALAAHTREDELGETDQAEDVGLELAAHLGHRDLLEGALLAVPGIVDQHADRTLGALDRLDRAPHRDLVAHASATAGSPCLTRSDPWSASAMCSTTRLARISTAPKSPSSARTRPTKVSSRRSAPRARSTSAKKASATSGPRAIARRTSRQMT